MQTGCWSWSKQREGAPAATALYMTRDLPFATTQCPSPHSVPPGILLLPLSGDHGISRGLSGHRSCGCKAGPTQVMLHLSSSQTVHSSAAPFQIACPPLSGQCPIRCLWHSAQACLHSPAPCPVCFFTSHCLLGKDKNSCWESPCTGSKLTRLCLPGCSLYSPPGLPTSILSIFTNSSSYTGHLPPSDGLLGVLVPYSSDSVSSSSLLH